jgi:hypothetical protein
VKFEPIEPRRADLEEAIQWWEQRMQEILGVNVPNIQCIGSQTATAFLLQEERAIVKMQQFILTKRRRKA